MPLRLPSPLLMLLAGLLTTHAGGLWREARAEAARIAAPRSASQLLGGTPELLRAWLGEPSLRRPEGSGAEVWLYAAEACALDLVLYRDAAGRLRVAFAAARAAGEAVPTATEAECLVRIAARHARYSTVAPERRTASAHFATSA